MGHGLIPRVLGPDTARLPFHGAPGGNHRTHCWDQPLADGPLWSGPPGVLPQGHRPLGQLIPRAGWDPKGRHDCTPTPIGKQTHTRKQDNRRRLPTSVTEADSRVLRSLTREQGPGCFSRLRRGLADWARVIRPHRRLHLSCAYQNTSQGLEGAGRP